MLTQPRSATRRVHVACDRGHKRKAEFKTEYIHSVTKGSLTFSSPHDHHPRSLKHFPLRPTSVHSAYSPDALRTVYPQKCSQHTLYAAQMSAQQKVQQHPAVVQATDKFHYYIAQLDKEVSAAIRMIGFNAVLNNSPSAAYQVPCADAIRATHSSPQGIRRSGRRGPLDHLPLI